MTQAPLFAEVAYTPQQIKRRVKELAVDIRNSLEGERPVLIAVLNGSVIFLADLVRSLGIDSDVDFLSVSSYSGEEKPAGVVRILKDLELLIEDRRVVLIEDIVDTGLTLAFLVRALETRSPKSLQVCTLVDKPVRRIADPVIHHVGFQTEEFLVGYGLDFKGRYRNLPYLVGVKDVTDLAARPDALNRLFTPTSARI